MNLFLSGPMTLLLAVLISLVLLRADSTQALQGAPATVRWNPPHAVAVADTPALPRVGNGGTLAPPAATALPSQANPFAPVYIVTSRDTWQGVRGMARDAVAKNDSIGNPLVIA